VVEGGSKIGWSLPPDLTGLQLFERDCLGFDVSRIFNSRHILPLMRFSEGLNFAYSMSDKCFEGFGWSVDPSQADFTVGPEECVLR
jgi:hypothetical protein